MINDLTCAILSDRIYLKEPEQSFKNLGYNNVQTIKKNEEFCIVANNDEETIVVVRGSDDFQDWMDNLHFWSASFPLFGRIHSGFKDSFLQIKNEVWNAFQNINTVGRPVTFMGHSKGGAIAELLAFYFTKFTDNHIYCTTFGAPRVGKSEYVSNFKKMDIPYNRYVNESDIVPRLPRIYMFFKDTVKPIRLKDRFTDFLWFGNSKAHVMSEYVLSIKNNLYLDK